MSNKKISSLMKKGEKLYRKGKLHEVLGLIGELLKISPDFIDAMNLKAQILQDLKKYEEFFQTSFNMNLLKLQKDGDIPSEINSPDSWIEEAITLLDKSQNDRGLLYLAQAAYKSPIVNRDGLSSMTHHENAKIYFINAIALFNMQDKYNTAMSLFEKANQLDPNLVIPDKVIEIYNDFLSNRSGKGVKMIMPLDMTNLRNIVPCKDKILVSTYGSTSASQLKGNEQISYSWNTHVLLSRYGLLFIGAEPVCNKAGIYVPWPFTRRRKGMGRFSISNEAEGINMNFKLRVIPDAEGKSRRGPKFQYIDELNIESSRGEVIQEMMGRIVRNLKPLENFPKWRKYIFQYERVPSGLYTRVKKEAKSRRKKNIF